MKKLLKIGAAITTCALAVVMFAACGATTLYVKQDQVTVRRYDSLFAPVETPLETTKSGNTIVVNVPNNTSEVEFDLQDFFAEHPDMIGEGFTFTRSDVKVGETDELEVGYAWMQKSNNPDKWIILKDGASQTPATKQELTESGTIHNVRMYVYSAEIDEDYTRITVYIDPTINSNVETGETNVTFTFTGADGTVAKLLVKVVKAAA